MNKINIGLLIFFCSSFIYSNEEFELMKADIVKFKEMGCKGIVSGVLNEDRTIDIERSKELVKLSRPLEFTFHRAFDVVKDPFNEIENLVEIGVNRILTSGQKDKAMDGLVLLEKLNSISDKRIIIMPGSGISKNNLKSFNLFREIHGSFKKEINSINF